MRFRKWYGHRRLRAFRAPVYVHWSVFAVAGVVALLSGDSPVHAAFAVVSYVAIIAIHESGHAWMARRRHYEVMSIRIAFFHGRCEIAAPDYEWDDVAIAWGGVLAQLAVAIPVLLLAKVVPSLVQTVVGPVIVILGGWNVLIAILNLMPAPGQDGQKAWRVFPLALDWWRSRRTARRVLRKWTRR